MGIKFVDVHTHPLKEYYEDNYEVIERAHKKGLAAIFVTGCSLKENEEVKKICQKYDYTFAVLGVHPHEVKGKSDALFLEKQIDKNTYAIGEIGLDYFFRNEESYEEQLKIESIQKESFIAQIEVAKKYKLPVVIHMRDSYEDLYEIIKKYHNDVKFMIHTFSGDINWAKKFYELGCYFSFSGIATYKNAKKTIEVLEWMPIDRILTETDAPFLSPATKRGKLNYPNYVIHTVLYIAGIKKMSVEKTADQILKNTRELFKINVSRK
ncbi:putative deoxyribonuclease [Mycoplasmopsis meleagridis]|uniref:Putative deoxyribonuclease YcfH n=1 Tax=Mycoplasmopsis meleagridis ATCC 25294 TaxID=1264554 RepID=A0A0F5H0A3_9BACT|nr:TatD family hydrolase [Mycoplasmopsis meleagridis]KKB26751.1 putative deoxyribonuclease YcfH [Mycoplasmopsis meleagridis ATCC 25294]OAD18133.1 putative deoxyribonuclease [Mycoplasmopsis meleagridis]VEU77285.1 TatD DNase family protein [Mycoplasmopsis meleagridis]